MKIYIWVIYWAITMGVIHIPSCQKLEDKYSGNDHLYTMHNYKYILWLKC